MINQETQDIIHNQFQALPPVIQDIVLHSNWQETIRRIVANNKLHIDQGAAIENLVFVTMLGIETPEHFVENAKEYARVNDEQAWAIATEVERGIFHTIREKLIDLTESHDTIDEVERVANELTKVDDDIERAADTSMYAGVNEISIPSKATATRQPTPQPSLSETKKAEVAPVTKTVSSTPAASPAITKETAPRNVITLAPPNDVKQPLPEASKTTAATETPQQKISLTPPAVAKNPTETTPTETKKETPVEIKPITEPKPPTTTTTESAKDRLTKELSAVETDTKLAQAKAAEPIINPLKANIYGSVDPYREPIE